MDYLLISHDTMKMLSNESEINHNVAFLGQRSNHGELVSHHIPISLKSCLQGLTSPCLLLALQEEIKDLLPEEEVSLKPVNEVVLRVQTLNVH